MPGVGKSTYAKRFKNSVDLDKLIELYYNKSIPEIFSSLGEKAFRKKEAQVLKKVIKNPKYKVISLGGGTIMFYNNLKIVKNTGKVIFIHKPVKQIIRNLNKSRAKRPLLKTKADLYRLYRKRLPYYKKADVVGGNKEESNM